jgi:DnaJ like chaperone protein
MTILEALAVVAGLFAGYWLVSKLFFAPPPPVKPPLEPGGSAKWHEILKVHPAASAVEIRAAYRQLISQYHPDKVEQLGPELKELAARKSQEITTAYRMGIRAGGERE